MFANLRMSSISFVLWTFDWDGGNGFVWRGSCKDWGTFAPQLSMSKKLILKENTGIFQHIGFDPDF